MKTNFEEHINLRKNRYQDFVTKSHFNKNLLGLHHIELNVSETCTRKCSFCPRHNEQSYPNKRIFMDIATIENIIKQCRIHEYKEEIHFTGFGESLSHPNILDFIRMIRKEGLSNYVSLTTNGDYLKKIPLQLLYESGLSNITISCYDGIEQYEYLVKEFAKIKESRFFIRKLWTDKLSDTAKNNLFISRDSKDLTYLQSSCYFPFYKMFIDYDGKILLCSNDWFRKQNLNLNINTHSLHEIWFNSELVEIRTNLKNKKRTSAACRSCTVGGTLIGKESFDLLNNMKNLQQHNC